MMTSPSPTSPSLTPVQAQVVKALAQGISITAAASAVGVHRSTVHNWLNSQKEFAAAVEEAREDYVTLLRDELRDLSRIALATVRQLLDDPKTSAGIRAKLALAVLQRPQYATGRSWNLPLPATALAEEQPAKTPSAREAARLRTAAQNLRRAAPVRQNSTERPANPPSPAPKPEQAKVPAGTAPVRQNSTQFPTNQPSSALKIGRNEPCPCGSGQKYKRCCLGKQEPVTKPSADGANTTF
jgi:AcrR family transcriptional regulator